MKAINVLAIFAALPSLGWACAVYNNCLCMNADGSYNDNATKLTCRERNGDYDAFDDGRHYCAAGTASAGTGGVQPLLHNNCTFREICQKYGATGDSNCWTKEF